MTQRGYATNLASEFYILSVLYRLGFYASLTLGNKKAVDISVILDEGQAITIDVKAVANRNDWMLGDGVPHETSGHYVILVSYENAFADVARLPRIWVIPSTELAPFVKIAGNGKTRFVHRKAMLERGSEYEDAWNRLRDNRHSSRQE